MSEVASQVSQVKQVKQVSQVSQVSQASPALLPPTHNLLITRRVVLSVYIPPLGHRKPQVEHGYMRCPDGSTRALL